ncbi:hypothetical protein [Methylobacterium nodulans]|uniref:Uncharacterized protein n=1 Tax=Methylobacterium nodulans (strain LMG 21967 / CNCM I-2342 / ORS 2060) TaxID=460265 RepID=B8IM54_METNO|nr:hypothetical protein [Methylobacterium nodulans]ACL56398.1 conserved hypothetical protein [Methylobacterium nodulans ORS 2060]
MLAPAGLLVAPGPTGLMPRSPGREPAWSRLPCQWVLDGGLRLFRGDAARVGRSTAALKLLLALAVTAGEDGSAVLSCTQLAALAGLSQSLIVAGKKRLCAYDLVRVAPEGQRTRFALTRFDPGARSARIPHDPAYRANPHAEIRGLRALSCRKTGNLDALKLYLLLCAWAGERDGEVRVPLGTAAELLNVTALRVGAALALLAAHDLASVSAPAGGEVWARPLPLP